MFYVYDQRFDVMKILKKICEVNKAFIGPAWPHLIFQINPPITPACACAATTGDAMASPQIPRAGTRCRHVTVSPSSIGLKRHGSAPTEAIEFEPDRGGWIVQENLEWPASVAAAGSGLL